MLAAAGGRFRNRVGRALFATTGLFQSCLQPDLCVNQVAFRLFGVLAGSVALRGKILPLTDAGDDDTVVRQPLVPLPSRSVATRFQCLAQGCFSCGNRCAQRVRFSPTVLSLGQLHLRLGKPRCASAARFLAVK